ncbi:Glutaredoxin-C9 like [Actinidia chinensis var. chinensis]|uniref:Glutaredoxin-C9 like n=1 Tax=Actinidia chinensis var. chinensis TaxID=1590841 RepID=A0A2R6QXG9_ACTCC|nr:Glutaredoxin-C9 like [Actinidia chinensis var. chinensis]
MQEALPYKTWIPIPHQPFLQSPPPNTKSTNNDEPLLQSTTKGHDYIKNMVSENAIIVFGRRGCCMSHVVKRLLQSLGVNPAVHEVDEDNEVGVIDELEAIAGGEDERNRRLQFPAVFIGGGLFGGLDRIMATHITGELIPILKQAGALWL